MTFEQVFSVRGGIELTEDMQQQKKKRIEKSISAFYFLFLLPPTLVCFSYFRRMLQRERKKAVVNSLGTVFSSSSAVVGFVDEHVQNSFASQHTQHKDISPKQCNNNVEKCMQCFEKA